MAQNIDLYEALKERLGEDAARMLAETVPPAGDIARKGDVQAVKEDVQAVKEDVHALREDVQGLKADIVRLDTEIRRLDQKIDINTERLLAAFDARAAHVEAMVKGTLLAYFVPLWIGTYATLVAILFRG